MLTHGQNFLAYLPLAFVLVLGIIAYFIASTGWKLSKAQELEDEARKQLSKSFIRQMVFAAIVLAFLVFSMFFAYGPGRPIMSKDMPKSGWMDRTEQLPDEKPLAVIQEEGEKNKDRTGTLPDVANEEVFKEEGKKVDKELDEMVEKWDKLNN